jgi:hypothetical protein
MRGEWSRESLFLVNKFHEEISSCAKINQSRKSQLNPPYYIHQSVQEITSCAKSISRANLKEILYIFISQRGTIVLSKFNRRGRISRRKSSHLQSLYKSIRRVKQVRRFKSISSSSPVTMSITIEYPINMFQEETASSSTSSINSSIKSKGCLIQKRLNAACKLARRDGKFRPKEVVCVI